MSFVLLAESLNIIIITKSLPAGQVVQPGGAQRGAPGGRRAGGDRGEPRGGLHTGPRGRPAEGTQGWRGHRQRAAGRGPPQDAAQPGAARGRQAYPWLGGWGGRGGGRRGGLGEGGVFVCV